MTAENDRVSDETDIPLTPERQAEKIADEAATHRDADDESSLESFPASDAPAP
jgi:hypothetical protein